MTSSELAIWATSRRVVTPDAVVARLRDVFTQRRRQVACDSQLEGRGSSRGAGALGV
jgi:hypothetical protein